MGYRAAGTNLGGKLKTKRSAKIGVLILMGGMLALITEAQFKTGHPTKTVQHFGAEASAYTKAALEAKAVTLEADPTGDTKDRYGRLLRYVHLDGENFNARLIRKGYGHAIRRFRYSLKAQFIRLEDSARKAGRGFWSPR